MTRRWLQYVAFVCLSVFSAACVNVRLDLDEDLSDYRLEVSRLEQELFQNPESSEAHRDLGVIYLRTGYELESNRHLQDAFSLGNRDPKLIFYLALADEMLGKEETALRLYETYPDVARRSPYRRLMAGRYAVLVRERANAEMQLRVEEEEKISPTVPEEAVAVYELVFVGADESYAPLGRGLAEMLSVDLSIVGQLRVLERTRLQALQEQIDLGRLPNMDPATSPRAGRFLGAGRIVSGSFNVLGGDEVQVFGTLLETNTSERQDLPSETEPLNNFTDLEKRMVFALLDRMGIELSEAEQRQIQIVPTRNLQAFLAYSRGLMSEDERDYGAAAESFAQAARLDPTFTMAAAASERATGMDTAAGTTSDVLSAVTIIDPPPRGTTTDLISDRLARLGEGVNSPLISTTDSRKPGPEGLPSLPDPPLPPKRRN
ncbi:MAG: hypothetical protein BMS9Abin05_2240 [Rhodothermia bacterium]|nr:MAG: hypothetical protein BMS9Abin05_2240 [Rhodothermia bacterium]